MIFVDEVLARRLTMSFGSWRRGAAMLAIARAGDLKARRQIEAETLSPISNRQPDGSREDLFDQDQEDGILASTLELGPGLGWDGRHILAPPGAFPETLKLLLDGHPVRDLVVHPDIGGNLMLALPDEQSPPSAVMIVVDPPSRPLHVTRPTYAATWLYKEWRQMREVIAKVPRRAPMGAKITSTLSTLAIWAAFVNLLLHPFAGRPVLNALLEIGIGAIAAATTVLAIDFQLGHPVTLRHTLQMELAFEMIAASDAAKLRRGY